MCCTSRTSVLQREAPTLSEFFFHCDYSVAPVECLSVPSDSSDGKIAAILVTKDAAQFDFYYAGGSLSTLVQSTRWRGEQLDKKPSTF